jgi:hypothetical protein
MKIAQGHLNKISYEDIIDVLASHKAKKGNIQS